ncbi:MAG: patatin-like phospholipase family protein [Streptosporangiaceae bacterium]
MTSSSDSIATPDVAFVLGGGGVLGGYQVGMLRALFERGIKPDFVVGTSVGSFLGAMLAANPTPSVCDEMAEMWVEFHRRKVMKISPRSLLSSAARLRPTFGSSDALRGLLADLLGAETRIEDLAVPYQCAAASIERATVRYFDSGPLIPAIMASSAVPGLWPPVRIGDEHYVDGGVVESVPMTRAVHWGARTVYVLRMRQLEAPLAPARHPWQLAGVVFELSRRHRMGHMLNSRPEGVTVHILPSGEESMNPPDHGSRTSTREELAMIKRRIEHSYQTASQFLDAEAGKARFTGKSANPVVSAHAAARTAAAAAAEHARHASPRQPLSPFVLEKLAAHFHVYDQDGSGTVTAAEYTAAADRIAAAFQGTARAGTSPLHDAYAACWARMCQAAGADTDSGLDQGAFTESLSQLAADPAAYGANLLPVVEAILDAADEDGDAILSPAEVQRLLRALGAGEGDAAAVARRLDTNDYGVISLDELSEAFRDYFTSDEPGCVGNQIFGRMPGRVT